MTNHDELTLELALLEEELEAEAAQDPLDLISELSDQTQDIAAQQELVDQALVELQGNHEQQ